ncbi:cytidine and dCMP deaminase domain-containing protein 1 [Haplochromis burtoni]|uniref:Cytidine and dCMP deaminase domain-containing protein 1 n=1 Tax=Haplochromis burtoni TaxID=8153 RepID=A0A3Q2V482_HAPBU|nr:cytidine and dCMP deaminase domain-containing protein 1 [Haplochromis burtoni]XP_005920134.1 cytidine and dCMP deaminase domain-containing protein 1 [Haplochromis burtoni]XP_005920135.1 cytidine and dCMP deaminase domain-containing protein 1 [Haplochromis burtoni]XP_042075840.1 cytidine and dCMP deaminase domain-containing protein 1 [Haplochromis burtoni]
MEESQIWNRADPGRSTPCRETRDSSTQTDSKIQGHGPRLSKVNLFTLLSLWMELFPQEQTEEDGGNQLHGMGLVVVRESKVVGLHCSGAELHAGQAAIIQHGARLADCQLYFSRRPCATCLKMIINAGVSQISFWPGDPEISILSFRFLMAPSYCGPAHFISEEALLDAVAVEKLKSNSRPHICMLLQPLAPGLAQFVTETSRNCDFTERITDDDPKQNTEELFNRERMRCLKDFSRQFLVRKSQLHQEILKHMGLENFCVEPYFSSLRNNMRELVEVLAAVAAGVPQQHYGFYREESSVPLPPCHEDVPQEVARHCMIQARLLAYRTEDPKVGVGTVIWAKGQSAGCNGTGCLYLVGCGYNAYPAGSQYAEYPQMDAKQEDRQRRKYRYIIHAEQNALTFRTRDIKPDEPTMLFVTKCPCDECVPLIRGAGITHIYTSDQDRDKDKGDISYLRFGTLKNISKFIWQRSPSVSSAPPFHLANGCVGKHSRQTESESPSNKKLCTSMSCESPAVSRR